LPPPLAGASRAPGRQPESTASFRSSDWFAAAILGVPRYGTQDPLPGVSVASLQAEALVIGGGSTGAGVARDAALRGLRTVLVERRDLADGTTGRFHGLLHPGGRPAVKDPDAAKECIAENVILRQTASDCIEDTGG